MMRSLGTGCQGFFVFKSKWEIEEVTFFAAETADDILHMN